MKSKIRFFCFIGRGFVSFVEISLLRVCCNKFFYKVFFKCGNVFIKYFD